MLSEPKRPFPWAQQPVANLTRRDIMTYEQGVTDSQHHVIRKDFGLLHSPLPQPNQIPTS